MLIVDVSASTEAFVETVCLIAVCRSFSGRTGCRRCGRVDRTPRLCSSTFLEGAFDEGFSRSQNVNNQHKIKVVLLIEFSFC